MTEDVLARTAFPITHSARPQLDGRFGLRSAAAFAAILACCLARIF